MKKNKRMLPKDVKPFEIGRGFLIKDSINVIL